MARTKQTARKTGQKKPKAIRASAEATVGPDYDQEYDDFNKDVLGDGEDSDSDDGYDFKPKGFGRRDEDEEDQQQGNEPYMLFDFRKGKECFPENVDLIDSKRAEDLLEKATAAAEEAAKLKKKDGEEDDTGKDKKTGDTGTGTGNSTSYSSWGESKNGSGNNNSTEDSDEKFDNGVNEATFETLKDGSTALIIKPGYRLRLRLDDLLAGGDAKKEERKKSAEKEKKRKAKKKSKFSNYDWPDMDDAWGDKKSGGWGKWFKEYINTYTITMDIKILEEIPREGISLYQTALIHSEENKRSGKTSLTRSDGECIVNQAGGVGMFGTYGDTTRSKVDIGCWRRIVVTVNCAGSSGEKGEMRTWIGTEAGVVLKEESIVANERFALDPDGLYLFSSAQAAMMPGNIAIRTIRIESKFSTDQDVKTNRARDKLLSRYDEDRRAEVKEQRKGLSLAELFPKPRPMWATPSLVGLFGDAFVERTVLEGSSNLAWSYTVLNHALQKMIKQSLILNENSGLDHHARVSLSDTLHIMQQSALIFKYMLKMLKTPNESQLISFLRKLKKNLNGINQGESLLFPLLVEKRELLLLVERTTERLFKFVVIQTDVFGLKNHSVSAAESAPTIKYRTCLVLNNISKKNALDDVFWVAVYNLAVNSHVGDTNRFYDVLLPFLTGRPLEESLVEAENAALSNNIDSIGQYGAWRIPQRSHTAYVRCVIEAMYFMLRRRGVNDLQCKLIHLGLSYQMVDMVKNDLIYMLPDESGRRVCALAVRELSHYAVEIVEEIEKNEKLKQEQKQNQEQKNDQDIIIDNTSTIVDTSFLLDEVHRIVQDVSASLEYCKDDNIDTPPILDLSGTTTTDLEDPALMQFKNMLAWEIPSSDPDPGQAVSLRKYIPIDFLQIPKKATTRKEAITAIRMCDRICTLIENQSHCIKNDKFLIVSLIEHVFTQVLPIPKPRAVAMTEKEIQVSERSIRRHAKQKAEEAAKAEEKAKKIAEKKANDPNYKAKTKKQNNNDDNDNNNNTTNNEEKDQEKIIEKVECFGEELLPDFSVGKEAEKLLTEQECIWDGTITYELQVELLTTLQRIIEHFAAATMSIQQSRPFDAVCIVVPGCMCAIADAIMRKIAIDEPSVICCHLLGRTVDGRQLGISGFGLSVGSFATQSETIEVHYPELSVARTAVIDYFQSPSQMRLEKIFSWEEEYILKPGKNLIKYLRMVGREIALPILRPYAQLCDSRPTSSHLMKNYPELQCYRDVAFWWKYFLNTDRKVFPNYSDPESPRDIARVDRMNAQLNFSWDDSAGGFEVTALGVSLKCRPDPKQINPITGKVIDPQHLPTHRFPSTATPSFYVPPPIIKTEDDVIYRPNLPSFEDKYGQVLNQRDSELLISYLTVPYMRLPLLITFFSSEDRIHKLQCLALRQILDSVMFEPGKYLAMDMGGVEPLMVPTLHPELLATPYGLLINELYRSPETIIRSIITLLKGALAVDTGSVVDEGAKEFNTSTMIILYITRLGCRVDNYLSFLIDWTKGKHDCVDTPLREVEVLNDTLKKLENGQIALRQLLHIQFENLFEDYLQRLDKQTSSDPTNESLIDRNSRLACDLHSHKLLMYRNLHVEELTPTAVKTLIGSFVYLTTRHTWNKATIEGSRLQMPETELYELLQVQRRRLIQWASNCRQGVIDEVMQTALQVSSSLTGSLKTSAEILDSQNRWSKIQGKRSIGRWAVGSTRTAIGQQSKLDINDIDIDDLDQLPGLPQLKLQTSYNAEVGEVADTGMLGVEIDVQLGQMTLRSKHLAALESEIANHPDVTMIFGDSTIQASLVERAEYRQCYRLVGLNHEIQYWPSPHTVCPPLSDEWEREYDPAELFDSEAWIVNLFEPIRKSFFDGPNPPPMQFMMPEHELPEDAEVAVLLGLHQRIGGPWKLVYLFRRLRCVHIYECVSQGREWWFSLHLTSDTRYCLREMQPSWQNRQTQYPEWWIHAGGNPYPSGCNDYLINDIDCSSSNPAASVVIVRDQQHHLNLSGGKEYLIPSRLLFGVLPDALLDAYIFWQDESIVPEGTTIDQFDIASRGYKRLRGYPKEEDGEYMIFVEFSCVGSWENHFPSTKRNNEYVIQATGLPGRTVTVTRRPKKKVEEEFKFKQQIAAVCESTRLLIRPQKKKEIETEVDADTELIFKVDAAIECDYEGKGEYWPCVVRRVNDNSTYDIEYVGDYKWVGIQRGVDPEIIQKRGEGEKKARGEGIWHWDGMSDSEDDDFRDESDDEDDDEKDEKKTKDRIDFFQFNQLFKVINASNRNLDACLAALHKLGNVPGVLPFTDVDKLAAAVKHEITLNNYESYGTSLSPFDEEDMFLLNLLYAPRRSRLYSVLKTLARIENASHICAWTKANNPDLPKVSLNFGLLFGCPPIDIIELPRLKLSFTARPDHEGILRLYSIDHVDIFITNERNSLTSKMLAGIPHSLLLSNVRGETQVLVPVIPPYRPFIGAEPFSTFIVLNRKAIPLSERFFLYPVHVSLSFLLTKGLNSAIYLMLLRFLHRDYDEVFRLADSIATDTSFNTEGNDIFQGFARTNDDWHPDAHSCRLKISLVTIDSGTKSPWDLTIESARHIVKLDSITSSCRLAPEEELQLLESDFVVTSSDHPLYDINVHDDYSMALCYNRQHQLRAQMELRKNINNNNISNNNLIENLVAPCKVPPRTLLTNWPYYQDNTVFGENYAQMIEIVSADDGELSWNNQVTGGDTIDPPPEGWLVIACFHTLWSTGCVKVMPAVTELVPLYQDMATFLTVRADCQGMASISKLHKVTTFPTFIFFRGGIEIERIVGHERIIEKLVRALGTHIKDSDKMAHAKRRHRIRLEKALEAGLQGPLEEEVEERGELEWTWDQEQCGESMQIEKEGMFVVLRDNEDDSDPIQWEYSRNNRSDWKEFSPEISKQLERVYKAGQIYRDGYANAGEVGIWPHNVDIGTYEVSGFYCSWNTTGDSAYVRRRGDRLQVPHEENYLSKEQKERDERSAEWRQRLAAYKKKLREERYGNDIESIKGSIGMLPNTGVHTWTLRWNHEPARKGVADGFGVCGDGCENFGPTPTPCLGSGDDTGTSLALYANGLLYHNGKVIHTIPGTRNIPIIPEIKLTTSSNNNNNNNNDGNNNDNNNNNTEDTPKKRRKHKKAAAATTTVAVDNNTGTILPKVEEVKIEDRAPLFGKKSLVTCIFDTTLNGGTLKFMIDKVPLDIEITQLYTLLGASEIFPAICLCPFDHVEEDPNAQALQNETQQASQVESQNEETYDDEDCEDYDEDGDEEDYDEEEAAAQAAAEAQAAELAAAQALAAAEELGKEPSVTLLPPGWEEEEQRQKEAALAAALAAELAAKTQAEAAAAAALVTISIHEHSLKQLEPSDSGWRCDSKLEGGCKRQLTDYGLSSGITRYNCKECDFDLCDLCVAEYLNPTTSLSTTTTATTATTTSSTKETKRKAKAKVETEENEDNNDENEEEGEEGEDEGNDENEEEEGEASGEGDCNEEEKGENIETKEGEGETTTPTTNVEGQEQVTNPESSDATTAAAPAPIEVEIPMNRIRWMWESESGWQVYSKELSKELEQAVRDGKTTYTLTVGGSNHKCNLESKVMLDDRDGNNRRLRRHVITEGIAEMWELLTMKYEKPMGLTGQGFLKILEKVWSSGETMDGKQAGLGFLFLYSLISGESRSKAISSGYSGGYGGYGPSTGGYMMYGGKGGYSAYGKKSSSSTSDSHRFALLLTQLFLDRHTKSLPASILNVLGRNRQVSLRMPRFKDTRKAMTTAFFNGWVDESEPRSPLGELFAKIVPLMRTMKRKAAFHFPPPPPYVELSPPVDKYPVINSLTTTISSQLSSSISLSSPNSISTKYIEWERPELSDYGCEKRSLHSIDASTVSNLASTVHYRLGQDTLKPLPPIKVEDATHFSKIIRENPSRLFVVDFYATWCGPCKALAPVFRQLALRTPTALFLKVDIDECDDLAKTFKIEKMPTVKFIRGGISPSNVIAEIQGGGPQFLIEFSKILNSISKPAELNLLRKFLMNAPGENIEHVLKNMATTDNQVKILAKQPLEEFNSYIMFKKRSELGIVDVNSNLAFDVTEHEASKTAVAHSVLTRIKDDVHAYADTANNTPITKVNQLSDIDIQNYFLGITDSEKVLNEVHRSIKLLLQKLYQLRDSDSQMVEDTIPLLERASNWVNVDEEIDPILRKSKTKFCLSRSAGRNSNVWIEFLFGVLISSKGEEDLLKLNPYLSKETINNMLNLVTISMLRSNRLGHTNRCIGIAIGLENLLQKVLKLSLEQRIQQGSTLMPKLIQSGEELSKNIALARHYITTSLNNSLDFDPRYLVFEFVWNIQLRQKQVEIVDNFRENLKHGTSKVKQMIMGAGKTSVVAPLLALILADGKSLVLSVVPKALVEMSRTRMRETFAAIMVKRIYTLDFDRSTTVRPAMRRSLENAARNRGVVVATPTTIKSIMLSYIEVLQHLKEAYSLGVKSKLEELKLQADELSKILSLFRDGVMLLDEVDLILHPLKSELNFPIGDKFDLDGSEEGERWNLPIHLLDSIFYTQTGKVSTFENRGLAVDILKRLSNVVQQGVIARNLQMLPHITLLNVDFYHESMKPILAEWAYLWLQKQHLHGIDRNEAVRYMLEGAAARSDNSTKVNLIELALTKALVNSGDLPPIPIPTLGYQKSMTEDERKRSDSEIKLLKEQASHTFNIDNEYHDLTLSQITHLENAKQVAIEHSKLVNDVYDIDEQIEDHVTTGGRKLGEVQGQIFALHKKIAELECPRDDSLDNSVIVWLSQAFASLATIGSSPASATPGESSVPAICNLLEDRGYTIKRCSDIEEAIARARDLQIEGHLRCVIVGGDEQGAGCGLTCVKNHTTNCLRCGQRFTSHSGHNCSIGGRGSFLLEDSSTEKISMLKLVQNLTDIESPHARLHGALPATRTAVYSAHTTIKEDDRMAFWKLGTTVTDESKQLLIWVSSLPGWKDGDGVDEVKEGDEDDDNSNNNNNNHNNDLNNLPNPIELEKQSSSVAEKNELKKLRSKLEELETIKNSLTEDDESIRKGLVQKVADKNKALEESVKLRIDNLTIAANRFEQLVKLTGGSSDIDELKRLYIGPHCGRDSALALAWLDIYGEKLLKSSSSSITIDYTTRLTLNKHYISLNNELAFLKQMALAAKVIAHVTSAMHKKLLNLCHNWLSTFLPHCLAKVNRVSFGLLSAEDCKAALEADPHVPRSRLKLAVPFVGKDVPSKSSEFAHPDVIIGLTILAYRYSGLRRDDYIDVVDALTSQFSHEIGPARDRESSLRHEKWVHASGGAIRGLKCTKDGRPWTATEGDTDKEVVQLKFLQKSNEEQMDKLYNLINLEPLVIHHYLQKTIFPLHMRSQRMKISASGQAVGGDMLVGRRVGFSGTPSDLLPQELGRCDYETGDDGMMLTTVLDRSVTSYEFLKDQWTVEKLLEHIATAENPRFNALIDTGALITGYSNKEVAQQLLDRGLKWCEGIVFLDDDDKQQVLVRATGRVVSADQCGVPLERRFAFYDQIHTTGMDIKHVVNATAVITLGKDMVFRDYVQGAYRMRGIGAGQKIHVFIIPEVAELMKRELKDAKISNHPQTNEHVLEDIVAWLIINSLRSEQVQWTMLCLQNIGNLYRKNAFQALHRSTKYFMEGETSQIESLSTNNTNTNNTTTNTNTNTNNTIHTNDNTNNNSTTIDISNGSEETKEPININIPLLTNSTSSITTLSASDIFIANLDKEKSLKVFDEPIDFSLEAGVPDPVPFEERLRSMLDTHESFLQPEQHAIGHKIMVVVGQFAMLESSANRLDTEQEREQEQEQEKEVEARRDKQIEVEKFVDREYSRQEEVQRPWPFSMLAKPISTEDHPFYLLKDFKLRHQEPLEFSDSLYVSTNYFNPKWTGLRRVKNVIMILEYAPSTEGDQLRLKTPEEMQLILSEEQEKALIKAHTLLGFEGMATGKPHHLTRKDLSNAIYAATDSFPSEEQLDSLIQQFSSDKKYLNFNEFKALITSGILHPEHIGRNWVAVSLAEAETIRRIIHIRQKLKDNQVQPLINNSTTEIGLRYSLMNGPDSPLAGDGGVILDASYNWRNNGTSATPYEAAKAHNSFRFFDCDMHYAPSALNVMIKSIHGSVYDRERFFHATVGCRRRMERKWQETPLARVFMVPHEWLALKQAAQAIFFREALKAKNLTLWEAFTAFDYNNSGMLSPSEFYGALVWLGVPDLTPDDIADFIEAADKNRDGIVDYREYMDMLSDPTDNKDEDEVAEEQDENRVPIAKVEPYGADELREVMIHRKQAEINRQKEERLRRQAYKDALDVKVFEEELEASKRRKGGANPIVYVETNYPGSSNSTITVTDFKFSTNEFPLRLAPTGKCSFLPMTLHSSAYPRLRPMTCPSKHPLGACYYSWMNCAVCKKRRTHYYCTRWCSYYVCSTCYDSDRRIREIEKRDPAKNPTFLRCSNSCSFTLQVPSAGGLSGSTDGQFTVSLEVRFEKLPPKGHLQSLLRFSLPDIAQTRRLHRTSVYLNGDGVVIGRALGKGGLVEGGRAVIPGLWQFITVSVKPELGEMSTYVNGKLCHVATGLDPADLRLHHKLVILGGGRQAHSRGGDIRRVIIHSDYLESEGIQKICDKLENDNPIIGGRILLVQSLYRGYIVRKKLIEEGMTIKKLSPGAQFVPAPQEYY